MKVGDTILCKKTKSVSCIKGRTYIIGGVYDDSISIQGEVTDIFFQTSVNYLDYHALAMPYFWDYFTPHIKDIRKAKLDELENK